MAQEYAVLKDKRLQKFLQGVSKRYRQIETKQRDYVRLISATVYADIIDHFEKEKGPGNKSWDRWSNSYSAFLKKSGKAGNNILQDTGKLRMRMTPIKAGRNFRKINNGILWFNAAKTKGGFPYAAHHDTGKSSWNGNPRTFMWLSDKSFKKIAGDTVKFLTAVDKGKI
jgi:phage gpG-like protein